MIETVTQDKFVVDSNGNKTAVLLEIERYLELLEAKEDLEEIRLFDAAKLENLENANWSEFSLSQAMKEMENEDFPEYSEADLKEVWR